MPVVTASTTKAIVEPPGWVFTLTPGFTGQLWAILKWISENHWDYAAEGRVPKVGLCGWRDPSSIDSERAVREYCQAHPDKFDYVGGFLTPPGVLSFTGEIEKLKDCDYVNVLGYPAGPFFRDFRDRGYDATFFGDSQMLAYRGFFVDMIGWEGLDGALSTHSHGWVTEPYPRLDLAKEILHENHPAEADDFIYSGTGYVGGFVTFSILFEMIRKAVEEVGAENFDGQAFYDQSLNFEVQFEGFPKYYFTETERCCAHDVAIYEWSAEAEDLIRISDWLPVTE